MVHLIMKYIMIFIFTVIMSIVSLSGQTLSLQNLIDLSEPSEETSLKQDLINKGFQFEEINETTQAGLTDVKSLAASASKYGVQKVNQFVYLDMGDYQEFKFITTDEQIYYALLEELRSEALQFFSFEKQKNAFREGDEIIFTSPRFPGLFIQLTDVKIFEDNSEDYPRSLSRYEFKVVRR